MHRDGNAGTSVTGNVVNITIWFRIRVTVGPMHDLNAVRTMKCLWFGRRHHQPACLALNLRGYDGVPLHATVAHVRAAADRPHGVGLIPGDVVYIKGSRLSQDVLWKTVLALGLGGGEKQG